MSVCLFKNIRLMFRDKKPAAPLTLAENKGLEQQETEAVEESLQATLSEIGQEHDDMECYARTLLSSLARIMEISQGAFFLSGKDKKGKVIRFIAGYAYHIPETDQLEFQYGEGLSGQVAKDGQLINIDGVPAGYINILSGLGKATPGFMIIFPVLREAQVLAVIELASFHRFSKKEELLIGKLSPFIAERIMELAPASGTKNTGPHVRT